MERKRKLLLAEMLSSSSSSSEIESSDDDTYLTIKLPQKRFKIENYESVVNQYSDEEFRQNFRLSRQMYSILRDLYEKSVFYPKQRTHERCDLTPVSVSILSFLWYAGNKACIRDVGNRFGLAESTFHLITTNVMEYLSSLAPTVIKFPDTEEEKRKLSNEFQQISGFPDVLGCIDGTFIPLRTPAHKIKSTYTNRHDMPSLTLQAICDNRRLFLDVFTGVPSKIHDARVFKLSFISKKLPNICGDKWHILGDAAYPIKKWLLTPYRDYGNLTPEQRNYNKKFCQTRVKIENSFGLLKIRFRQLMRTEFKTVERTSKFIISCCVLHNLCILNGDDWTENIENKENMPAEEIVYTPPETDNREKREGEEKRSLICALLYQ